MRIDPRTLVRRLTPSATRLLESAVGRAVSMQHGQVGVEHLLSAMVDAPESELSVLLTNFGKNGSRLAAQVQRQLELIRSHSGGRPVFSDGLLLLLEHAWVWASLERNEPRLRSGAIIVTLLDRPNRYLPELPDELGSLAQEKVRQEFDDALSATSEAFEVAPPSSEQPSGAAAPKGEGALGRFTQDVTAQARAGKIDPALGRHRETRQLIDILARRRKNNPILVGEPGVGKTALVEALAQRIVDGDVPETLRNVVLLNLDLGMLQAGASVRGEFEQRLKAVIQEVKASSQPIVLFIDEAHTLIGAGGAAGGADAANLLKPALARGELRTIAATTWSEYKKYFEKDPALARRFQPVHVEEPNEEDAIVMLRGVRERYEAAHGVTIRDEALQAAVKLSRRYLMGRQLPDKAVDLLDTASARVRIEQQAQPQDLIAADEELAAMMGEQAILERDLRETPDSETQARLVEIRTRAERKRRERQELEEAWNNQRALLNKVVDAQNTLREVVRDQRQDAIASCEEALRAARTEFEAHYEKRPLLRPEVDADSVAATLSSWTGIPVGKMRKDTGEAMLQLEDRLRERVVGQDAALETVGQTLRIAQAGINKEEAPLGVLLFVGPSGVGKTETALALADALYGGERALVTINLSEYQEKHSVSRLVGSPPGYVGYGEGGILTEAVRQRPYSAVLLDECEKADPEVMNLFYQVFDKGVLSDGEGRTINFRNTLIILTSNLASDRVAQMYRDNPDVSSEEVVEAIGPVLRKHFGAALVGRMHVVPYRPLNREMSSAIVKLKTQSLAERIRNTHRLETHITDRFVDALVHRAADSESGARHLDHMLRGSIASQIATTLLQASERELSGRTLVVDWEDGTRPTVQLLETLHLQQNENGVDL